MVITNGCWEHDCQNGFWWALSYLIWELPDAVRDMWVVTKGARRAFSGIEQQSRAQIRRAIWEENPSGETDEDVRCVSSFVLSCLHISLVFCNLRPRFSPFLLVASFKYFLNSDSQPTVLFTCTIVIAQRIRCNAEVIP